MHNIAFVAIALTGGFTFQVIWWRIHRPSISSVISLFSLVFVVLSVAGLYWGVLNVGIADYARLMLLYVSIVLSYTIVCSAVEVPSPTVSIITYVADRDRRYGCPEKELVQHFLTLDAMADRLKLMEVGGLVRIVDGRCILTNKALSFARLFESAARFFGLPKGG